ncbi:PilZ domain-containing protein [Methylobacterium sp. A49B]|uniref:PilZ domain-containing protein n=1 Tax=Methylobacterium mesophilicum SR1.6/6 TaxID=908290 RepID=A0A6B9FMY4_9HYPH|nr:PilZ domain-containing protein [Methylobacterium mesophilicum]QGY03767.1 hypothetical protein MMSR116_19100 [Methylobacterium mesophilicum SR1.6/6]
MEERRAKLRAKVALTGHAAFPSAAAEVRCLVINVSNIGACLSFPSGVPVPRMFNLRIGPDPKPHAVRVAWRRASDVGVAFLASRARTPDVIPG